MPPKQIWVFRGGSLQNLLESFNTFRRRCRKFSLTQRNSKNNTSISSVGRKALWCIFVKIHGHCCQDKGCGGLTKIVMNCESSKISEWLKVKKISLNFAKTNYILFRLRQKPITVSDTITLDNIAVQKVEVEVSWCFIRSASFLEISYKSCCLKKYQRLQES